MLKKALEITACVALMAGGLSAVSGVGAPTVYSNIDGVQTVEARGLPWQSDSDFYNDFIVGKYGDKAAEAALYEDGCYSLVIGDGNTITSCKE